MADNTVESTLFVDIATSDYGVIQNGTLIMDGQDIYPVQQYHFCFEQGMVDVTPVSDGVVCAYTLTDGVLESYDEFIE